MKEPPDIARRDALMCLAAVALGLLATVVLMYWP